MTVQLDNQSIDTLSAEAQDDLLARGFNRRDLGRIAAVFGAGAAIAATTGTPAWASGGVPDPAPTAKTRIGANECWTGPLMPGQMAAAKMIAQSNRYAPHDERGDFIKAVMAVEGVPYDYVAPWPGSSDPLCRSVITFCSPTKGLVTANPTFELAGRTAEWLGAPLQAVPLLPDMRHDVKGMLAANPNAGLYYICTPNNPTGTITPIEDIVWLLDNKPAGAKVLVDEAYTHFAGVPVASKLTTKYPDLIVMRTFSKIFGMAGMRMGFIMTQPANIEKMMRYDGGMQSGALPLPSLVCATASLTDSVGIAKRKAEMEMARGYALDVLKKKGIKTMPTKANMFMIDWGNKSAKDMQTKFRTQSVEIGRSWPIWPNVSRLTVGSMEDMKNFALALDKVWTA